MILLTHVFAIAFAVIMANRRLLDLLRRMTGRDTTARAVLFSWLGGNLFLGAQLAWNLRPFIGSPGLTIQFLRDDPPARKFLRSGLAGLSTSLSLTKIKTENHMNTPPIPS